MPIHFHLDDGLIAEAVLRDGHRAKNEAVTGARREYVRRRQQLRLIEDFGKVDVDPKLRLNADFRYHLVTDGYFGASRH